MAKSTFRVRGAKELEAKLKKIGSAVQGIMLEKAAMAGGLIIRDRAEELAPHLTGFLEEKIEVQVAKKKKDQVQVSIGPHRRAFYGHMQEFGTVKHAAQPFMRPSFDEKKDEATRTTAKFFWGAIRAVAR